MKNWRIILASALLVAAAAATVLAYQEAPMFEKLVAEGKLPPVEERLPDNPRVITPNDQVGRYGGTAHVYTNSQFWLWSGELVGFDWLLTVNPDYTWGTPNILESFEFNEDATSITLHLRKGLKWSDGVPFTAEDFMYHWVYVANNPELFAVVPDWLTTNGVPLTMASQGDHTVVIDFVEPNSLFLNYISHAWATQAWQWWFGLFQPAHYCKQFHPAHIGQDRATEMAEAAGVASWVQHYWNKTGPYFGIQDKPYTETAPVLTAYVCVERSPDRLVWERNPYYWKVDTDGNQLPYIDRIILHFVESSDVIDGKIISGEVDAEWILADIDKLPVYTDNAEQGGYDVRLWSTTAMALYELNLTHPDPAIREIIQDVRFRQALSLAIDRDEINEALFYGLATPRSFTVPKESPYFKEGFDTSYIEYDPVAAEALLDAMGLDKKDAEGFRLRPDGERLRLTIESAEAETMDELVREYWRAIGLDIDLKAQTQDLLNERVAANLIDIMPGGGEFNIEPSFSTLPQFYVPLTDTWPGLWANQWSKWNITGGTQGEEPIPAIQDLIDWYAEIRGARSPEDRIEPAQKILQSHADNLWQIGIVGGSPWIVIVKDDLKNVPETGLMTWDLARMVPFNPQQFYFEGREPVLDPWPGRFD